MGSTFVAPFSDGREPHTSLWNRSWTLMAPLTGSSYASEPRSAAKTCDDKVTVRIQHWVQFALQPPPATDLKDRRRGKVSIHCSSYAPSRQQLRKRAECTCRCSVNFFQKACCHDASFRTADRKVCDMPAESKASHCKSVGYSCQAVKSALAGDYKRSRGVAALISKAFFPFSS